jgi:hypothetical protein
MLTDLLCCPLPSCSMTAGGVFFRIKWPGLEIDRPRICFHDVHRTILQTEYNNNNNNNNNKKHNNNNNNNFVMEEHVC